MRIILTIIFVGLFVSLSGQQTIVQTINHDGEDREFIVYLPAIYDGSLPVPLMFNFHGYTGAANGHMNGTRMRRVAEREGFVVVYPQGTRYFGSTHWNVGSWTQGSTADDLGFTEAMIDTLSAEFNIDLSRIYSCGYSNGGYFSYELACKMSHRIAAIGSVGGKMSSQTYNACSPSRPIPVITIHGTQDNIVSYYGSTPINSKTVEEVHDYWIEHNASDRFMEAVTLPDIDPDDASTVEYFAAINGNECARVDHYKVIGGGHDWPGAWGNKDIDASSVIWDFVSQYSLEGKIDCEPSSTDDRKETQLSMIFPNPTADYLNLNFGSSHARELQIFTLRGKLVYSKTTSLKKVKLDLHNLEPNFYLLRVGEKVVKFIKI